MRNVRSRSFVHAHEGVQARTLGGAAGDGKRSIGTMDPPTWSMTLTETTIDSPGKRGMVCLPPSSKSIGDNPSKPVTDQPVLPETGL